MELFHAFLQVLTLKKKYTSGFKFAQLEMSKQATLVLLPFTFIDIIVIIFFFFSSLQEVVLSLLIESFEFTPSEKEIFWQMSNIVSPTVVGGTKPQLPIMVKLVQPIVV